jgi:methionyl-tRNA formyltransferase
VLQPLSLRKGEDAALALAALKTYSDGQPLDILVVAAYGLILPQSVLDAPRLGCLNIHGSLLPRWRGAAPIQRAIQAGDPETGVCIMQMDAGLDTGAVRLTRRLPISETDTAATLHDRLAALGSTALIEALREIEAGQSVAEPQSSVGLTYAEKITKDEGHIQWTLPAIELQRTLRAFDPFPGCSTLYKGELLKCFDPRFISTDGLGKAAGTVLNIAPEGITIQTGQGALLLTSLQKAGSKRGPAAQIAQSMGIQVGDFFEVIGQGHSA